MSACHRLVKDSSKLVVQHQNRSRLLILRRDRIFRLIWHSFDLEIECDDVFLVLHAVELGFCLKPLELLEKLDSIFELKDVPDLVRILIGHNQTLQVFELCQKGLHRLTVFLN